MKFVQSPRFYCFGSLRPFLARTPLMPKYASESCNLQPQRHSSWLISVEALGSLKDDAATSWTLLFSYPLKKQYVFTMNRPTGSTRITDLMGLIQNKLI